MTCIIKGEHEQDFRDVVGSRLSDFIEVEYAMVGYRLNNTLTDNGHVTRGVCQIEEHYLSEIVECKRIKR